MFQFHHRSLMKKKIASNDLSSVAKKWICCSVPDHSRGSRCRSRRSYAVTGCHRHRAACSAPTPTRPTSRHGAGRAGVRYSTWTGHTKHRVSGSLRDTVLNPDHLYSQRHSQRDVGDINTPSSILGGVPGDVPLLKHCSLPPLPRLTDSNQLTLLIRR